MPSWLLWSALMVLLWGFVVAYFASAIIAASRVPLPETSEQAGGAPGFQDKLEEQYAWIERLEPDERVSILVVDDDPHLRELLRTSLETAHLEVVEAESAATAARCIAAAHPDVIVLDVGMPVVDGLTFCRGLKSDPRTRDIPVVLLTGDPGAEAEGREAGASAFLRKPFSPLALLREVERLAVEARAPTYPALAPEGDQLLLYAQDFRQLLELERAQRHLLENAYRETVLALAHALESKDDDTGAHSERVRRYATELTAAIEPTLLDEPGLEYGYILHDVGKIAIPDGVLRKAEPLTPAEQRLLQSHPVLGEQMIGNAALLRGQGAKVVRSHHERWDGAGYPDGLIGDEIPLPARIFSVVDALDAITSDRPYRPARSWPTAVDEITREAGSQFDPAVVEAFRDREEALRRIYYEISTN